MARQFVAIVVCVGVVLAAGWASALEIEGADQHGTREYRCKDSEEDFEGVFKRHFPEHDCPDNRVWINWNTYIGGSSSTTSIITAQPTSVDAPPQPMQTMNVRRFMLLLASAVPVTRRWYPARAGLSRALMSEGNAGAA